MRITYVLNSTDSMGGATKSFIYMLRGIIAQGHHTMVVVPDRRGIFNDLCDMGCEVVALNYRPNIYPRHRSLKECCLWVPRLLFQQSLNILAVHKLVGLMKKFQPDIVHTNVSVIDIGCHAAKALKIPHIYHFREYGDLDFAMHYFPCKSAFLKTVEYSICITSGIQKHHSLHTSPTSRVIYNPVSHEEGCFPNTMPGHYILFAGRLEPAKGLGQLLKAYARSRITIPLWIAGEERNGEYVRQVKRTVDSLGIKGQVLFLGARDDILHLMRNARALVVPSFFEAFGRCAAEAMLQACLVVGRDTAGTREQFENGLRETGGEIGLRFSTEQELVACLQCLEEDCDFLGIRKRAFEVANKLYTVRANVCQVLDFYNSILK